jgi:hypothetical protein
VLPLSLSFSLPLSSLSRYLLEMDLKSFYVHPKVFTCILLCQANKHSNNNLGLCCSVLIGKDPSKVAEEPQGEAEVLPNTRDLRLLRLHMKNFPLDKWNIWNGSNAQVNANMKCTVYEDEDIEMKAHEPVEEEVLSSCVWHAHVLFLYT